MDDEKKVTNGSLALNQSKVIVIESSGRPEAQKLRVAAYARVSTDSADQANSFHAQMEHYQRMIAANENWTMIDVYADRGVSGTSAKKRPDFQRMLTDCRQGKIDKILVKSISRFARNTKECLEIVRELKAIGVGVCFEEQNIDTAKVSGELLTSVFAALAQKESESISQNMRWSYQARIKSGTFLPGSMAYGYRIENKRIVIDSAKAENVRRIFREYLSGYGLLEITKRLNADNVPADESGKRWTINAVSYILSNERYIGDSLWQKKYATDDLPAKKVRNHGEREQYYATGTQEPIIEKADYEAVQELRKRRAETNHGGDANDADPMRAKLRCGVCGSSFRKREINETIYWACRNRLRDKNACPVVQLPEHELHAAFLRLYDKLRNHGDEILYPLIMDMKSIRKRKLLWSVDIVELNKRISDISEQNQLLASMNQMGLVDPDIFIARSNEYATELREAKRKREKLLDEDGGDDRIAKTEELLETLAALPEFLPEYDGGIFDELTERVELTAGDQVIFHLTNGLVLTETVQGAVRT